MRKQIITIALILSVVVVGALTYVLRSQPTPGKSNKLSVSTAFYPVYFFTTQIGKDLVDVRNITPAGVEPHDYEPTAQDVARIEESKLLILNGGLEAWADKIKDNLEQNVTIVTAGEGLFSEKLKAENELDPHIWLSPKLAKKQSENITSALINVDSTNRAIYQQNFQILAARLDQLDQNFRQGLSTCRKKDIITSHTAFSYFAKEYGLNQVSIAGLSPDEEPSSKQLAEIAKFAQDQQIKYIFFESLISPKLAETIAAEMGAQTLVLDPIEGISDDEMKQGQDYFTKMESNLKNLQIALECQT